MEPVVHFFDIIVAAVVLSLSWFAVKWWILARLYERHPSTYEGLDCPKMITQRRFAAFHGFLWSDQWRYLADRDLRNSIILARALVVLLAMAHFIFLLVLSSTFVNVRNESQSHATQCHGAAGAQPVKDDPR